MLVAELFFPSRRFQRLEKERPWSILDVNEATGQPRLTAADAFGSESQIGLLCHNDPVDRVDPMGEFTFPLIDAAFIGYDIYAIATDSSHRGENWAVLGLDIVGAAIPGVSGLGKAYKAGRVTQRAVQLSKAVSEAEKAAKAAQGLARTKTDRLLEHVTPRDLSGAAKELRTGDPQGGQHLKEVTEAADGLRKRINQINNGLSNPKLSPEERKALENELGRASRGLDAAERALQKEDHRPLGDFIPRIDSR